MSTESSTWSKRISDQGLAQDMREYQKLKEANEMEIDGTRRLYEKLKREHGEEYALKVLKSKGYNPSVIGK